MSSSQFAMRLATEPVVRATLEEVAREGARRALQRGIEDEVAEYPEAAREARDDAGRRLVVRNGHKPARRVLTGVGPLRTYRTKGPGSRRAALAMTFKLAEKAQSGWRKLNGTPKLQELIDGIVFVDGMRKKAA